MSPLSPPSPPNRRDPLPEQGSEKLRAENSLPAKHRYRLQHRLASQDYCGRGAVLGASPDLSEVVLIPIKCKSWDCKYCSKRKAYQAASRISSGAPNKFITLTIRHDGHPSPGLLLPLAKHAWPIMVKRIRREFGSFEYALVWELTKKGAPHLHIAARSGYIPQRWLSAQWDSLTNSPVVDIRAIRSPHKVAKYVIKYMLKAPTLTVNALQGGRLIQMSRDYLPSSSAPPKPWEGERWTWSWLDRPFYMAAEDLDSHFDTYEWTQDPNGMLHLKALPGWPLATVLTKSTDDSWDMVAAYRIEEARLEREQGPNTDPQRTLFP